MVREIYKKIGIVTVVRDWVFNSLSLYSVQPLDEYKFTAEENMSEDDENDASDKDSEMDFFGCGDDDEKDPDYADLESESKEEEEYVSDSSGISELFPVQSNSKSVEALRKKRANIITEKEQKPLTVDPYSATGIDPVRVQASKNKDGIRIWDKIHYCMYCGEGFTNITKHYLGPHKQEMEVQRILSLPLKSEKRKLALMKHRNSGDYKHNVEVLKNGTGTLVTWTRKDKTTTTAKEYLPCEDCLAFFLDKNLWRHRKICPFRKNDRNQKRLKSQASLLLPSSVVISEGLQRKVLSRMNTDEITMVVRNDPVILRIGENCSRNMVTYLICIHIKLCGYVEENNKYSNPSLALKIGHLLKKCAKVKKAMSLISADTQSGSNADAFLTLCESEWSDDVSIAALQTLSSEKRNKGSILPLTEDITKIQRFLKEKSSSLTAEIEDSLSLVEKMLCDTFERVEIRGKKGRTVPVLLTPCLIKNIDCLMKYREESGVSKENPYLFPRSSFESLNPIRSADCLRRFAQDARLEKPENLTSTQLRKHVATISQVLNLSKSDLENMANFLGHDIEIHRSFYRIPQQTLEIAKMGRLLTAFDNGTVSKYSGKTLDEIPVDDVEELQLDGNISSDDCFESDSEKVSGHQLFDCSKKGNGCSSSTKKEKVKLSTCQSDTLRREFQEKINLQTELKHEDSRLMTPLDPDYVPSGSTGYEPLRPTTSESNRHIRLRKREEEMARKENNSEAASNLIELSASQPNI
ncbi:uncharacterized protein LOC132562449 [Ylistrum balloti]|uniref:uncharacterized protein LOC132562449 n=1 Tax=Ylistrum balloti TaxID=509963 RepID=UPI002905AEF3|nr:uncharacterized protein LOC132562449 [Ylistrum balloti]